MPVFSLSPRWAKQGKQPRPNVRSPMRPPFRFLFAAAIAATASGCAEPPFVDKKILTTIEKPVDSVVKTASFSICYSEKDPFEQVLALADETCAAYGLQSRLTGKVHWQCRISAPHTAQFACYDPEMVDAYGAYINPANRRQVESWIKRTGRLPTFTLPGKPYTLPPATPDKAPAAAPATPEAGDEFSLPMGGWGENFEQ